MNFKSIILLLSFFGLSSNFAKAQTLPELFDIALENNLQLKVLENQYLAALEVAPQVSQRPDPELGFGVFPFPVETRLGGQVARLSVMQMLLWPGVRDAKNDLALANAKSKYELIAAQELELHFQVQQQYYNFYKKQKSQQILKRNLRIFDGLEQLALANIESGKGSAADVLRIQLKSTELETEIEILGIQKIKPQTNINQLLQRELDTELIVRDSLSFAVMPIDKESLLIKIEEKHPMLQVFALQQEVSKQAIEVNKLSDKPSFGLGMDYIMVNKRTDAEPEKNGRDILQLRAAVKIPLNKKKYIAKANEEALKIKVLDYKKTDLLSQFTAHIENAYTDFDIAQKRINLYQQQIEITKGAIRILETNYSNQASRFDELLRLEKDLMDYDLKILNAIVDSHLAKSQIDRLTFNL